MRNNSEFKSFDFDELANYLKFNSYLSKRHKIFYVATPKVACTSLKWWFADIEGLRDELEQCAINSFESTSELAIHDTFHKVSPNITGLSKTSLIDVLNTSDYFKFALVRNPFTRLFSAWQSKLLYKEPLQSKNYIDREFFNHPINSIDDIARSFEKFLQHLAENEVPDFWDPHWTPQTTLLHPEIINYTKISKLEDTKDLSVLLKKHLGENFIDPFQTNHSNESLIPFVPEVITTRSIELIQKLYSCDFTAFKYSKTPPQTSKKFSDDQFEIALKAIKLISERNKKLGEHNLNVPKLNEQLSISELNVRQLKDTVNGLEQTILEKENTILESELNVTQLKDTVNGLEQTILEKDKIMESLTNDLKIRNHEIQMIKASRIYSLTNCLSNDPFSFKKLYKLTRILAGIATPEKLKRVIRPTINENKTEINFQSDNKPKVLHVIANFMLGGSSRLVADIVQDLDNYHHEVVTSATPDVPAYPKISPYQYLPGTNPTEFEAFLNNYSPDIVHIHYWGDCDEPWYKSVYQSLKSQDCKIIENINTPVDPLIEEDIDRYVYVSDYVKTVFGSLTENSVTIHPGSDFELFNNKIENVVDDCIGMVYRLENDKLNLESIDPFIDVVKKRPQTKVIIVGGGTNLELYKKKCKEAGVSDSFIFTGYVEYETLPEWYKKLSLFVAPVWKESFGQVAPFAMSMGLPVVGYNIGALPEIIGKPELLAEYGNSEQLADIIIELLNDRERRLEIGEFNQKRAQERFSVQAMTESYQTIYDELVLV